MREKALSTLAILILFAIGAVAVALASYGQPPTSRFLLALFPLIVILFGVGFLRQSGLNMAIVGLILVVALATLQFETPLEVAVGASLYGFIKSFGISISVAATMLMIFLMRETGALGTVSKVIKQQVKGNEVQALYIGVGFGSFVTSLGVVTPALFPPLLIAMGFSSVAAVAIAVLGYNATTSFALLSIPITLPAQAGRDMIPPIIVNPLEFAFKITLFLPLISTAFAFALLWVVGGKDSMRKGAIPAAISGLVLGLSCLGSASLNYFSGMEYIPLRIIGIIGGLGAMLSLHIYQKVQPRESGSQKEPGYPTRREALRAFSPWIVLTALAAVVSIPQVGSALSNLPGSLELLHVFADKQEDLNVFSQIYTWIFVAIALSLLTLRPTGKQAKKALAFWLRRFLGPFLTYSLYFSVSYVMAFSAMEIGLNGALSLPLARSELNMNVILGTTLAAVFGAGYIFVAAALGLFGAVVGGSETSSNVLFLKIQKTATEKIGLDSTGFMTIYGSHAVTGGVASAITPAKINNAVVTIDESRETESLIMRKHLVVATLLTIATGVLTGVLVSLGI